MYDSNVLLEVNQVCAIAIILQIRVDLLDPLDFRQHIMPGSLSAIISYCPFSSSDVPTYITELPYLMKQLRYP